MLHSMLCNQRSYLQSAPSKTQLLLLLLLLPPFRLLLQPGAGQRQAEDTAGRQQWHQGRGTRHHRYVAE
jgi:hypothetical protein